MYKVLLVDDNKREVRAVAESIDWTEYGAKIIGTAANGREALDLVRSLQPDIVITDIVMPAMTGIELAQELNSNHPAIKVALFTYHDDFHYMKTAIDLGVEGYLLKPVNPTDLVTLLKKIVVKLDIESNRIKERELLEKQLTALRTGDAADPGAIGVYTDSTSLVDKKSTQLVKTIKNMIHAHYQNNLTVEKLASEVFYSARQANIIFKKETGLTIYEHLINHRMEIAKKLLKETDMSITAIIREVGYTNNSHFTLIFKRCTGMNPSDFRRS